MKTANNHTKLDINSPHRALITGHRGFIGSHLWNTLVSEGWELFGIDNNFHSCKNDIDGGSGGMRATEYIDDIRNKELIDKLVEKVDIVFHLAAQIHVDYSIEHPQETIDINITGTLNVLEACRKYKKKLIFASSSEVYGTAQSHMITEVHPLDAQSPYAASKVAGDRLCKAYIDTYGMDICIVRNFNTFGPYQNDGSYGGVIAIFTRNMLEGQPLKVFGDGSQERDYMYIDDAIQAYRLSIGLTGVYNFGTGKTVRIDNLAKFLARDIEDVQFVEPRPGEVMRLCADIQKAKSVGFEPKTDFYKDLVKYVTWKKNEK